MIRSGPVTAAAAVLVAVLVAASCGANARGTAARVMSVPPTAASGDEGAGRVTTTDASTTTPGSTQPDLTSSAAAPGTTTTLAAASTATAAKPTTTRAATTTAAAPLSAVTVITETVLDPTRSTPARGTTPAHQGRSLPTTIYVPTTTAGRHPVVVFAHGYNVTPATYDVMLRGWAAHGFIVAAPLFPISGGGLPGAASESDLNNQPGDMSAVISHLMTASSVTGRIDPSHIAVAGHSDGGTTAGGMAYLPSFRDTRVAAYLLLAADTPATRGAAKVPTLEVCGDADEYRNWPNASGAYHAAGPPVQLLEIVGGRHLTPFIDPGSAGQSVRAALVWFLQWSMQGDASARRQLDALVGAKGLLLLHP